MLIFPHEEVLHNYSVYLKSDPWGRTAEKGAGTTGPEICRATSVFTLPLLSSKF